MNIFTKLKHRLGINSNIQFTIIMVVFGITGSLALYLSKPILSLLDLNPDTTNNQMELKAVIEGLKFTSDRESDIVVLTDSMYVINGINKWIKKWIRNSQFNYLIHLAAIVPIKEVNKNKKNAYKKIKSDVQ